MCILKLRLRLKPIPIDICVSSAPAHLRLKFQGLALTMATVSRDSTSDKYSLLTFCITSTTIQLWLQEETDPKRVLLLIPVLE